VSAKVITLVFHLLLLSISLAVAIILIFRLDAWPLIVFYWIILSVKNLYELMKG